MVRGSNGCSPCQNPLFRIRFRVLFAGSKIPAVSYLSQTFTDYSSGPNILFVILAQNSSQAVVFNRLDNPPRLHMCVLCPEPAYPCRAGTGSAGP